MITQIIKPETALEQAIIHDPAFTEGAMWGKPRGGHPEGKVIFHIGHVLANVDKYAKPHNREQLRLIAIVHDAFKYKVDDTKARHGDNHHGMIARRFAERYIADPQVLDVIELHDEAYNAWGKGKRGDWYKALMRAEALIARLGDALPLYLTFYRCDNETGDKKQDNYYWFLELIRKKEIVL